MYETYLQNERELDRKYTQLKAIIPPTRGWISVDAQIKSHNRLSIIKVMKALEKELEGEILEIDPKSVNKRGHHTNGAHRKIRYNKALNLAINKIREFISKLEQQT